MPNAQPIRFIDLFAGIGGFRLGFEYACQALSVPSECVFTSEIKDHACTVYRDNFKDSAIHGDITQIPSSDIPDFDVLLAGFPCQAFSSAGKRHGFADTRGTLFFEIERILRDKSPDAFILENVEGLVNHDSISKAHPIGRTLSVILDKLESLGYHVEWRVLNASDFGLAQSRKRLFIVGSKNKVVSLDGFITARKKLKDILEKGLPTLDSTLAKLLLSHFSPTQLYGKAIKDKRGGKNNIHGWDIGIKGEVSNEQKALLSALLRARRNKKWGAAKGITWMDGMPLTVGEIHSFFPHPQLKKILDDLVQKKYLRHVHPKDLVEIQENGRTKRVRKERTDLEKGYNIATGKLSYEISKILNPEDIAPTLVATDLDRVAVCDGKGLRKLTVVEQCRLFGFPDNFKMHIKDNQIYDLFGNTVPVNIVSAVVTRLISEHFLHTAKRKSTPVITRAPRQVELAL